MSLYLTSHTLDAGSMECVTTNLRLSCPLADNHFYMLIETSGSNEQHDEAKLTAFLERMMDSGVVEDGTVATAPSKQSEIWQLRERIAEAMLVDGYCYKADAISTLCFGNYSFI